MLEAKFFLVQLAKSLLLPPGILLLLFALALWLLHRRRIVAARRVLTGSLGLLLLFSLPLTGDLLMSAVERYPALSDAQLKASPAQAIVILSGGRSANADEFGGETVDSDTLRRLRYGARIYRLTGKPILVTGGTLGDDAASMAELMARVLDEDYGITARWREDRAWDTKENAEYSAQMLKAAGITNILLVTSAWHLNRAVPIFEKMGMTVTAAGTGYAGYTAKAPFLYKLIPSGEAVYKNRNALHELLGAVYYWLRY